jgi:DNA (cytosine-5)-methyltransferase 1
MCAALVNAGKEADGFGNMDGAAIAAPLRFPCETCRLLVSLRALERNKPSPERLSMNRSKRTTQNKAERKPPVVSAAAVDLFCGAGGLTRGLLDAGIPVVCGYDTSEECQFPYEQNNEPAVFLNRDVVDLEGSELARHYPEGSIRILVGCAPCVTFSRYTQKLNRTRDPKWSLLRQFARLVTELQPDIVSMENVPELQHHSIFREFLKTLKNEGYHFSNDSEKRVVYCPDYGVPQHRSRLVILASRLGPIEMIPRTHSGRDHRTVRDVLAGLPHLKAGERSPNDRLHRTSTLSPLNLKRIRKSRPGGTWRDWPEGLVADCHKEESGETYPSVYGRMQWGRPSPTITTQFYGFGNGRFGHPEQDRAISLREGAVLQSFPKRYKFVEPRGKVSFKRIGRMIGNAVPVRLGKAIGRSIKRHLTDHAR